MNLLWEAVKRHLHRAPPAYSRDADIERLFRSGQTYEDIGVRFGLTRERVRQIIFKRGLNRHDGGYAVMRANGQRAKELARVKKREAKAQAYFGCDADTVIAIAGKSAIWSGGAGKGTIARIYYQQFRSAKNRKIRWEFNLASWWRVWQDSGKWEFRGRGAQKYCMSRTDDSGPYSPDNVVIRTNAENISDGYRVRRTDANYHQKAMAALRLSVSGLTNKRVAKAIGVRKSISQMLSDARRWVKEGSEKL